jgi:hypothetical protein
LIYHFDYKYTTNVQSVHLKRRNTSFYYTTPTSQHHALSNPPLLTQPLQELEVEIEVTLRLTVSQYIFRGLIGKVEVSLGLIHLVPGEVNGVVHPRPSPI